MQQLISVWESLDNRRRLIAVLSALAVFVLILTMSRMAAKPRLELLYSGLDPVQAGDVVAALEQQGVAYQVRNAAIFVDAAQRDRLRMVLAAEGLPATGSAGYELLDNLSGFGTTSQMFDAAYWRAKEGELARTIVASPHVRSARVHIAYSANQPFRTVGETSASVTVIPAGAGISALQAKTLRFLVASSVPGLTPAGVSVIDGNSGLVFSDDQSTPQQAGSQLADTLRANVERLLTARMGPGRAVVEVSVETETDSESIIERRFDPEGRVAISTETEENSTASQDQGATPVSVASNLAQSDEADTASSSSNNSQTRERVNYEVSETQREVLRKPGAIRRISVAVMVDGVRSTGANGAPEWAPLPPDELDSLTQLVSSAVGYDEARGDVITVKSLPFQPLAQGTGPSTPGLFDGFKLDLASLIPLGVVGLVTAVIGIFVLRPILTRTPPALPQPAPAAEPDGLVGEIQQPDDPPIAEIADIQPNIPDGALMLPGENSDPVSRLRLLIDDRRDETMEILRHWVEDESGEPA